MKKLIFLAPLLMVFVTNSNAESSFASFVEELNLQREFYQILQQSAPETEVIKEIDAALNARYRQHVSLAEFKSELRHLAVLADRDPQFSKNPMTLASYQELRGLETAAETILQRVESFYRQLLKAEREAAAFPALSLKITMALNTIDHRLATMPIEDQIELADLIRELQGLRMAGNAFPAMNSNLRVTEMTARAVKRRSAERKREIDWNVDLAVRHASPRVDALLKRALSLQIANNGSPSIISPGTGREGNIDGYTLPEGVVALTFDDGPHPAYTPEILNSLNAHRDRINKQRAPATFFWLSSMVANYKGLAQRAVQEGYSTHCHSWSHRTIPSLSGAALEKETTEAVRYQSEIYGRPVRYYRLPGGAGKDSARVREKLASLGLVHVFWSIDSLDWRLRDPEEAAHMVIEQLRVAKRGIILMHDIHEFSVIAAKKILNWIKQQNDSGQMEIKLYTIEDAVALQNQAAKERSLVLRGR